MIVRLLYFLFSLLLLFFFTSCNNVDEEKLPKNNTIYLPFIVKDNFSINPLEGENDITGFLFEPLLKADKRGHISPCLINSWSVSKDFLSWTFKLRSDVYWSDMSPFTADDVVFTLNYLCNPSLSPYSSKRFEIINSIKKIDKFNFEIKLKEPYIPFLYMLSDVYPVPGHIKDMKKFFSQTAFNGPYVLSFLDKKKGIGLSLNTQYWNKTGTPGIKDILFRIYEDKDKAYKDFLSGKIDMINNIGAEDFISLKNGNKDVNLYDFPDNECTCMGLNLKNPLFSDKKVRQAISYAIDRKIIVKFLLYNYGQIATGPVYPFMSEWYKKTEAFDYNPKKVNLLMEEAGWHKGNKGFYEKDGKVFYFKLTTYKGDPLRERVTTVIIESLLEMGIAVEPVFVEWNDFLNSLYSGKLDSWCVDLYSMTEPDLMTMVYFYSEKTPEKGGNNYGFYVNSKIDKLLSLARKERSETKRVKLYFHIQDILSEEVPVIYLYHKNSLCALRKHVFVPEGSGPDTLRPYGDFYRWTLNNN